MKIQRGWLVKIADIGTLGRVIRVDKKRKTAIVEFDFPEGRINGTIPIKIICSVISRGVSQDKVDAYKCQSNKIKEVGRYDAI